MSQEGEESPPHHVLQWQKSWNDFQLALHSPRPFHQWYWIRQLLKSMGAYIYGASGLEQYHVKQFVQSLIPVFALSLIGIIWWSYLSSLRPMLCHQVWCEKDETTCTLDKIHSTFIAYIIFMITWHYLMACFSSPGVALPNNDSSSNQEEAWKARNAQGGFLCFNAPYNADAERKLVALYGTLDKRKVVQGRQPLPADNCPWEFPMTNPSYCEKCDIVRPPRCHHCKTCNRCTLQADHHCVFLNQCVGINNYRSFILLITYVLNATGYGVGLLLKPFYQTIRKQIKEHGIKYFYKNKTGFLDLPMPRDLYEQAMTTGIDSDTMLRMMFPLLLVLFSIFVGFCAMHFYYVVTAQTTLEHKIMLYILKDKLDEQAKKGNKKGRFPLQRPTNPFSQGWKANVHQVLGPNLFLVLLPIPVSPPPPYIPQQNEKQD